MKRVVSYVLSFVLVLSIFLTAVPNVKASETGLKALPQVGQVVSGFRAMEVGDMELTDSRTVLFEHEKTGAKLLFVQNKDNNRTFDISFKTPAFDNSGVNHVLEHLTISGSQKYPLKNVLYTFSNQTYSTFANAFTFQNCTTYPVSSMSEDQLLKLADVYLDCVFHPSVCNDRNIFAREAWRYEMADSKADLKINGTVYNEMKGALGNISAAAAYNDLKTLFPNSTQSTVSGGDPDKIKDLKYEDVIKTHDTYYHPSNSLMVLYGNVDYEKFLKMINDNYLSGFDKKDIKIESAQIEPFGKTAEQTFKYPVAAGTNTSYASQIDYSFALGKVSDEDRMGLAILAVLLNSKTSALKQEFMDKKLGGDIQVGYSMAVSEPVLTFYSLNTDESKKAEFKALVDKYMADIVKTGFNKEEVDAVVSGQLLGSSNITEVQNLGMNIAIQIGQFWANFGSLEFYNNLVKNIKDIAGKTGNRYFENLIEKYIQKNSRSALVTTVPEAGLAEKQNSENVRKLSDLKKTMNQQQIDSIVNETKSYNEWNNRADNKDLAKSLQVVKIADLPEVVKDYNIKDNTSQDGVRMISGEADVGETELTSLYLDTSSVPADKLHYLQLYSDLLGNIGTKAYEKEKLSTLKSRYLNGITFNTAALTKKDSQQYTPVLEISWMGLIDDYDKQLEILKDILLNTQITNSKDISDTVKTRIADLKSAYSGNSLALQSLRSSSYFNAANNYLDYTSGLDYFYFLTKLEKEIAANPESVLQELNNVKDLVVNKWNLITIFIGNKKSIARYENSIKNLTGALPSKSIEKQDYSKLPKPERKEGIAVDSPVQCNMIYSTFENLGTVFSGKYIPIGLVVNETYAVPKLRFGNGAYDSFVNFNNKGLMLASYRDPNIKETFEIYRGLPDFVKNINITQEQLDSYILKAYSDNTAVTGELSGASTAINYYLAGITSDDIIKVLKEIKSVTVQDVKDSAPVFEKMVKNGAYSTTGRLEKLNENKELYDAIIVFGQENVQNTDSDKALTRGEFFELVLAGVPNPLEVAKQQGLLTADSKGNYYENRKLTREELAVIICKVAALNGIQLPKADVKISDISSAGTWSREAVKALVGLGVIKLDANGKYNPKGEVTASFVQTVTNNLNQKLAGK
ncbi:MAG TPA: insulinase family protein [Ruminiclostridium sp.]|nr:insulinase family protein [Ruminiclostridium sp.]